MTARIPGPCILLALLLNGQVVGRAQGVPPADREAPKPILSIGVEGQPEYEFNHINTAFRTPSGAIAVADEATKAIRIYGADGRFLRALGRDGDGPGEFRRIASLFAVGDTLIAYDAALRRLTSYSVDGRLLWTRPFRYPPEEGSLSIIGRLGNGGWIVVTGAYAPTWNKGPGVYRDTSRAGVLPPSATGTVRWFGTFPGMTFFVHAPAGRQAEWRVGMLPSSPYPIFATWRDSLLIGDLSATAIAYYAPDGHASRSLRLPQPALVADLTPALNEDLQLARTQADSAYARSSYVAASKAAHRRTWESLVVADNGTLWLAVADPRPTAQRRYLVVEPSGRVVASWRFPPRYRLLSISGAELLVATRDGNDVERIVVIRL